MKKMCEWCTGTHELGEECAEAARRFSSGSGEVLPIDGGQRKNVPIASGVLDYFPAAIAEVAKVSKAGNDKHNPGEPLHHARGKSMDHADCIARHLLERGTIDPSDGLTHTAHLAWRALALLQEELEAAGAPMARGGAMTGARGGMVRLQTDGLPPLTMSAADDLMFRNIAFSVAKLFHEIDALRARVAELESGIVSSDEGTSYNWRDELAATNRRVAELERNALTAAAPERA